MENRLEFTKNLHTVFRLKKRIRFYKNNENDIKLRLMGFLALERAMKKFRTVKTFPAAILTFCVLSRACHILSYGGGYADGENK